MFKVAGCTKIIGIDLLCLWRPSMKNTFGGSVVQSHGQSGKFDLVQMFLLWHFSKEHCKKWTVNGSAKQQQKQRLYGKKKFWIQCSNWCDKKQWCFFSWKQWEYQHSYFEIHVKGKRRIKTLQIPASCKDCVYFIAIKPNKCDSSDNLITIRKTCCYL